MKYLVTSFFFFVCSIVYSQETSSFEASPNSVYVELIGNGIMYSVNYDRVIKTRDRMKFSARIGFSYVDIGLFDEIEGVVVPIELLGWIGDKGHFEFGAGLSSQFVTLEDDSLLGGPSERYDSQAYYLTGRLGYRLQKPDGGFLFRAGFVPMVLLGENNSERVSSDRPSFVPWFGFSFGYSF